MKNLLFAIMLLATACYPSKPTANDQRGAKIYLASSKQMDTVMGGGSIRNDQPFFSVQAEDAGKSFRLNR